MNTKYPGHPSGPRGHDALCCRCWGPYTKNTAIHSPGASTQHHARKGKCSLDIVATWLCWPIRSAAEEASSSKVSQNKEALFIGQNWSRWPMSTCHREHHDGAQLRSVRRTDRFSWPHRTSWQLCAVGPGGLARIFSSPFHFARKRWTFPLMQMSYL